MDPKSNKYKFSFHWRGGQQRPPSTGLEKDPQPLSPPLLLSPTILFPLPTQLLTAALTQQTTVPTVRELARFGHHCCPRLYTRFILHLPPSYKQFFQPRCLPFPVPQYSSNILPFLSFHRIVPIRPPFPFSFIRSNEKNSRMPPTTRRDACVTDARCLPPSLLFLLLLPSDRLRFLSFPFIEFYLLTQLHHLLMKADKIAWHCA